MTRDQELEEKIRVILRRDLQKDAQTFEQLKGGRNSRVFRVDCANGEAVAVKAYFRSDRDWRD